VPYAVSDYRVIINYEGAYDSICIQFLFFQACSTGPFPNVSHGLLLSGMYYFCRAQAIDRQHFFCPVVISRTLRSSLAFLPAVLM